MILSSVVLALAAAPQAAAAAIKVNTTADEFGSGGGCALREAVQSANTNMSFGGCVRSGGGPDVILLRAGKTYLRSIGGSGDDNATGDLDLQSDLTIRPQDRRGRATIDAGGLSRVVDVFGAAKVSISRVNLIGGTTLSADAHTGAGALIAAGSRLTLSGSAISGNSIFTPGSGGGIENAGTLVATRVRVALNRVQTMGAASGGGIESTGDATLDRSIVTANQVSYVGGGVTNYGGKMTVTNSTISGNRAAYSGGGLYLSGSGATTTLRSTTISGNTSAGNSDIAGGGGIAVGDLDQGRVNLFNITISGNSAAGVGGGMVDFGSEVGIVSSTIVFNTGDSNADGVGGTGGIFGGSGGFTNSIVYGNRDLNPGPKHRDCFNVFSQGHNLLGDASGCVARPTDITGRAPKLGRLAGNGGPTLTHLPRASSPVIGRGSARVPGKAIFTSGACTGRDQRSVRRPQGARCDIGAVERRLNGRP